MVDTDPITLTRFILQDVEDEELKTDLVLIMSSICTASKGISDAIRKAGIANLYGLAGSTNVQGEDVKKLDVISNEFFINCLSYSGKVAAMVSEENDLLIPGNNDGKYILVFDPLDGSSNIDAAVPVGSIYGIYRRITPVGTEATVEDANQPGSNLICAGYSMYASATMIVISFGNGVNGFSLNPGLGEFTLTHPNIRVKSRGSIYSVNEGNEPHWLEAVKQYVESRKGGRCGSSYSLRYVGSMVADVHRTLLYGGMFGYPADKKSMSGKLRLLYECNPMSFLMEQAGGSATTGTERILDIVPKDIHARVPILLGSPDDILDVLDFFAKFPPAGKDAASSSSS